MGWNKIGYKKLFSNTNCLSNWYKMKKVLIEEKGLQCVLAPKLRLPTCAVGSHMDNSQRFVRSLTSLWVLEKQRLVLNIAICYNFYELCLNLWPRKKSKQRIKPVCWPERAEECIKKMFDAKTRKIYKK